MERIVSNTRLGDDLGAFERYQLGSDQIPNRLLDQLRLHLE